MLGYIIVGFINTLRWIGNVWRVMWRKRVDYVRIELSGALPEFADAPRFVQRRFFGQTKPFSLQELRRQLQRIAADPNARGVLLRIRGLEAGWATLQSLRDELERFRATGKRVVAYVVTLDTPSYYTACAADEIITPPTAFFNVLGVRAEVQFLKDALAKVGIAAEVEAVSPYKSAYEPLVRSHISPENRAQLERLIDRRFDEIVRAIATGRGKTSEEVHALIDRAPLSAHAACAQGLIDALCYEDELEARLKIGERKPIMLEWSDACGALKLPYVMFRRKLIGVVAVEGTIMTGSSRKSPVPLPLFGAEQAGSDSVSQTLRRAEQNQRIAAVVLYVNSHGGDAFASDLMWREVLRVRRQKPVVVVMGDAAASGGYYIAAPASTILAQPGTLTGSIGVVSLRPDASELLDRAGVSTVALSRGANSGLLSISAPPTESERLAWREQIAALYGEFKQRVCEGRGMTDEQLEPIAGGRVWTGHEALQLGLVDQLGGIPEGVLKAQELAGLPQDRTAPLVLLRDRGGKTPPKPFPADTLAGMLQNVEELLRPRVWAIMPFEGV
jgi:protease-4